MPGFPALRRLTLGAALLLPACGDDEDNPPTPPAPVSFIPAFLAADARLDADAPGAAFSFNPRIDCDGDDVYVIWTEQRSGQPDIYFRRSTDAGTSWHPEIRLDNGVAGAFASYGACLVRDGARLHVAWLDERNGAADVYYTTSPDRGATWAAPDVRLDTDTAGSAVSSQLDLACAGGAVYAAWADARDGQTDIYLNRSTNGATWGPSDLRLDTTTAGASESGAPRICAEASFVGVAWEDRRNGPHDIFFRHSQDRGATWPASEARIDTDLPGAAFSRLPKALVSGSLVLVLWQDGRSGSTDVYLNRSPDGGATWQTADIRVDSASGGTVISTNPVMALAGSTLYVAWDDNRAVSTSFDIFFRRSPDAGATWPTPEVQINAAVPGQHGTQPQIAVQDHHVYVTWMEARTAGMQDVFFNFSVDGGATWPSADLRLDTDAPGAQHSFNPRICADGTRVYVVWDERRNGMADVYLNRSIP